MKIRLITTILIFIVTLSVSAQRSEVGGFGGLALYNGDINPLNELKLSQSKLAYGFFYRYNFDSRLAIKLSYTRGTITGNDGVSGFIPTRENSFNTNLSELSAQFEVNFFDFGIDGEKDRFTPYIFGGIGSTNFQVTQLTTNGTSITTIPSDLKSQFVSFPLGVGVKFCPVTNMTLGIEWGIRKTTSNKLDGIDTDPYRSSADNDWYSFTGFSISYRLNFFNSQRCY